MRCQKCGIISFDWLETCGKCGTSLLQERERLGQLIPDNGDVNWFVKMEAPEVDIVSEPEVSKTSSSDISQIDVSDLVADGTDQDIVEIEEQELLRAAEDEEFQKALEEIA